jgi:hypothetical protein
MPKYNNIDTIPAKVFFKILETKDYQLLCPKPKEKGLEEIFIAIYDDFFIKSDNPEANQYLKVTKEIAYLTYKIAYLKQALHFYFYNQTTEQMRIDFLDALEKGYDIIIDRTLPFIDEVHRVLTIEIGIIENDLSMSKFTFEQMTKKSKAKVFEYEEQIVSLENVVKRSIADDITLAKYIAYEKSAQKIISQLNKKAA